MTRFVDLEFIIFFSTFSFSLILTTYALDEAYPSISTTFGVATKLSDDLKPIRREVYGGGKKIFDISHRYTPEMPAWESSEGLGNFLRLLASIKNGSIANNSEMKLSVHSGTHLDAPGHFYDHYYDAGFDVDSLDLQILNGPALLVDVPRDKNITAEVMESLHIPRGIRRVLFKTLNTDRRLMFKKEFDSSFVGFVTDGAKWLVENTEIKLIELVLHLLKPVIMLGEIQDIKLVGLDYLSFAAYDEAPETHRVILEGRDIIPIEALKLDDVEVGMYTLHCLPMRLVGAEGAPTRCILIK